MEHYLYLSSKDVHSNTRIDTSDFTIHLKPPIDLEAGHWSIAIVDFSYCGIQSSAKQKGEEAFILCDLATDSIAANGERWPVLNRILLSDEPTDIQFSNLNFVPVTSKRIERIRVYLKCLSCKKSFLLFKKHPTTCTLVLRKG